MEQIQGDSGQPSSEQRNEEKRPGNDSRKRGPFGADLYGSQPPKSASAQQRWNEFRPSKTMLVWSMVGAVVLTMLVGFTWGGWMTSASAQKMATTSATSAIVERLAPMCVAQFNLDPDKDQKLLVLQEGTSYERTKYVTDQTWATLPGETKPASQVASACANLLMQLGQ